jgi:alpha-tubulin suppressor-like RCC1 family protein
MKIALVLCIGFLIVPIGASAEDSGLRSLTAGAMHTCVLTTEGKAYCWGSNQLGQLGDHTTIDSSKPVPVDTTLRFSSITAGDRTTCGIARDGTNKGGAAYCWGENTFGQIGTSELTENCGSQPCVTSPRPVSSPLKASNPLKFSKIATNRTGSCGLTVSGDIYCWGDNGNGQLGQGDMAGHPEDAKCTSRPCSKVPIAVKAPAAVKGELKFSTISVGDGTNCAVALDGRMFCWGDGQYGQLGKGSTIPAQTLPVQAKGRLRFATVAIGVFTACGVATDRAVYCWGGDMDDALGTDTPPEHCSTTSAPRFACSTSPNLVNNLKLRPEDGSIGIARTTACGIDPSGRAFCWGAGGQGQLGDGITNKRRVFMHLNANSPQPVEVAGKQRFQEIAVGSNFACGIGEDKKTIYCWGGTFGNAPQALPWDDSAPGGAHEPSVH